MNDGITIKRVYIAKSTILAYGVASIVLVNSELSKYSRDTLAVSEMIGLLPSLGLIQSQG